VRASSIEQQGHSILLWALRCCSPVSGLTQRGAFLFPSCLHGCTQYIVQ
jgi:hypothetical protein